MSVNRILFQYYNSNIQLHISVIKDIIQECLNNSKKMLVFGLGNDSDIWSNLTNNNTYFVESEESFIQLCKSIDQEKIIKHNFSGISVKDSFDISDKILDSFEKPDVLLKLSPFDIILIDGPNGFSDTSPGRLLPIYWSKKYLSKKGTVIYVDDCNRKLESYAIDKYLIESKTYHFSARNGCDKFII